MSNENKKKKKVKVFTNKQKSSKSEVAYIQELEAKYSDIVSRTYYALGYHYYI